jgi:hypothetical protein
MITAEEALNNLPGTIEYYLNKILTPAIVNLSSQGYRELILSDVPIEGLSFRHREDAYSLGSKVRTIPVPLNSIIGTDWWEITLSSIYDNV